MRQSQLRTLASNPRIGYSKGRRRLPKVSSTRRHLSRDGETCRRSEAQGGDLRKGRRNEAAVVGATQPLQSNFAPKPRGLAPAVDQTFRLVRADPLGPGRDWRSPPFACRGRFSRPPRYSLLPRGCSSAGRALQSHCRGRGFESHHLHQRVVSVTNQFSRHSSLRRLSPRVEAETHQDTARWLKP